jgi:hypothetical protein
MKNPLHYTFLALAVRRTASFLVTLIIVFTLSGQGTASDVKVNQNGSGWTLTYDFGHKVDTSKIKVTLEGDASNSEVPTHSIPKFSKVTESEPKYEIIKFDEQASCFELLSFSVRETQLDIKLSHKHDFYEFHPLLGKRKLSITYEGKTFSKEINFTEQYKALPNEKFTIPADFRNMDTQRFFSAPDSLVLIADEPGSQYFRFNEIKVRASVNMKLSFMYFFAEGSQGELKVRLAQYREVQSSWKVLSEAGFETTLPAKGRWTKFEKIIRIDDMANTCALDFRISNADFGDANIDDVKFEPTGVGGRDTP